jgi:NADPH-dependent curcumin reductase CurA
LVTRPSGTPTLENFELVESDLPQPADGQFLVRNHWLSVDPYMRGRMNDSESYVPPFELNQPMDGGCVGEVIESNHSDFAVGDHVVGQKGWRDLWTTDGTGVQKIDVNLASPQSYLGVLGITGLTAYVGLLKIANLKEGETVFISAASGAVGSIACQIAKIKNCRVIGSAGSSKKIEWLKSKAGIDEAFNYKKVDDVSAKLKELCPDGIDVYFDNVGGDHLAGAIDNMNKYGRIVCCGMISAYNDEAPQPGPSNLFKVIGKEIRMQGFIVSSYLDVQGEFVEHMTDWIGAEKVVWEETITEGLENAPQAFLDLFNGDKMGKAVVKV